MVKPDGRPGRETGELGSSGNSQGGVIPPKQTWL